MSTMEALNTITGELSELYKMLTRREERIEEELRLIGENLDSPELLKLRTRYEAMGDQRKALSRYIKYTEDRIRIFTDFITKINGLDSMPAEIPAELSPEENGIFRSLWDIEESKAVTKKNCQFILANLTALLDRENKINEKDMELKRKKIPKRLSDLEERKKALIKSKNIVTSKKRKLKVDLDSAVLKIPRFE